MSTVAERIRPLKATSLLRMGFDVRVGKRALLLADGQPLGVLPSGHYGLENLGRLLGRRTLARLRAGRPSLLVLEDREIPLDSRLDESVGAGGERMQTRIRLGVRIVDPEVFHAAIRERTDRVDTCRLGEIVVAEAGAAPGGLPEVDSEADLGDTLLVHLEAAMGRYGIVVTSLESYRLVIPLGTRGVPMAEGCEPLGGSMAMALPVEASPQGHGCGAELQQLQAETELEAERARGERLRLDAELEARSRVYECEMTERVRWFEQRQREATARADLQVHQAERLEALRQSARRTDDSEPALGYDPNTAEAAESATENLHRTWTKS